MTKTSRKTPGWLLVLIFVYAAFLAALSILNLTGADRWWFGALNLYLPQSVWLVPGICISALTFLFGRKLIWLPLLCIVWVIGPIMGFCWPTHLQKDSQSGSIPIRVMTWNIKYGLHGSLAQMALKDDIDRNNPTVALFQDAAGLLEGPLGTYFSNWYVRSNGQYIIASRLPLGELEVLMISYQGEEHTCLRTHLQIAGTNVTLYNVHLLTPRSGLNSLRIVKRKPWYLPDAIQQLENNVEDRITQGQKLRDYVQKERGPVIIAGDLNSPESSEVCATLRSAGFHDAFAEGGKGYGYTYGHFLLKNRVPDFSFSWMRIDHIMTSYHFQARRCWTGTKEASDHRPVIADLVLNRH